MAIKTASPARARSSSGQKLPFALRVPRQRWHVDEGCEARAIRVPLSRPRASRDNCRDSARRRARTRSGHARCARPRADGARGRRQRQSRAVRRPTIELRRSDCAGNVGQERQRIARARLDAQASLRAAQARTSAAHRVCVWRSASAVRGRRQRSWSGRHGATSVTSASAGRRSRASRSHQRPGRIERRAGKRPEAGDEDGRSSRRRAAPRSPRPRASARACRRRRRPPPACSFARTAGSLRSRAVSRSSSMVHIHLTCCSRRRAGKFARSRSSSPCARAPAPTIRQCRCRSAPNR